MPIVELGDRLWDVLTGAWGVGQMRDLFPGLESGVVLGLSPVLCLPGCAYLA